MLRQVVIWGSFALALVSAFMVKAARWGEPAFFFLALSAVFAVVFLFALSTKPSVAGSEKRPSVFRIGKLWLLNKERDLENRLSSRDQ